MRMNPGSGTGQHLSAELIKLRAQIDMAQMPYNGGGPAVQAVLADQVPIVKASNIKAD